MSPTAARLLEETARAALAAAAPLEGVTLLLQNEDLPADSADPRLPCVVIAARAKADNLSVVLGGRPATDLDLELACRVAANRDGSPLAAEALAAAARAALEGASGVTGWILLQLEYEGDERGFDKGARVITLKYTATALPA